MAFALLSRLRYLNLKNNCLAVFPDVVSTSVICLGCYPATTDTACDQAHRHALT
jgi:hypothetical protein